VFFIARYKVKTQFLKKQICTVAVLQRYNEEAFNFGMIS